MTQQSYTGKELWKKKHVIMLYKYDLGLPVSTSGKEPACQGRRKKYTDFSE